MSHVPSEPVRTHCATGVIEIRREDLGSAVALALVHALDAELTALYPEEGAVKSRLDRDEVAPGQGAFLVAYIDSVAVACGALRRLEAGTGEIKRIYCAPAARGRGLGARLLAALVDEARRLHLARLLLETGDRLPAAIAMFTRAGFVPIPCFGEHAGEALSLCMEKRLA